MTYIEKPKISSLALTSEDLRNLILKVNNLDFDNKSYSTSDLEREVINRITKYGIKDIKNITNLLFDGLGIDQQGSNSFNSLGNILKAMRGSHGDLTYLYLQQIDKIKLMDCQDSLLSLCKIINEIGSSNISMIIDRVIEITRKSGEQGNSETLGFLSFDPSCEVRYSFNDLTYRAELYSILSKVAGDNYNLLNFVRSAWENLDASELLKNKDYNLYDNLVRIDLYGHMDALLSGNKPQEVICPLLDSAYKQNLKTVMGLKINDLVDNLSLEAVRGSTAFGELLGNSPDLMRDRKIETHIISVSLANNLGDPQLREFLGLQYHSNTLKDKNFRIGQMGNLVKTVDELAEYTPIRILKGNKEHTQETVELALRGLAKISDLSREFVDSYFNAILDCLNVEQLKNISIKMKYFLCVEYGNKDYDYVENESVISGVDFIKLASESLRSKLKPETITRSEALFAEAEGLSLQEWYEKQKAKVQSALETEQIEAEPVKVPEPKVEGKVSLVGWLTSIFFD